MENSYNTVGQRGRNTRETSATYLLDGHDDLDGVQAVKPEVFCKVGSGGELHLKSG